MSPVGDSSRLARLTAARRLRERPLRSTLTAAGVAAGVALLFSITLLNAQMTAIAHATGAVVTGPRLLQVSAASPGGLPDGLAGRLAGDARVPGAAPILIARTSITAGGRTTGAFVIGITADIAAVPPQTMHGPVTPSGDPAGGGRVVSLTVARRLRVRAGQRAGVQAPTAMTDVAVGAVVSSPLLARINGGASAVMPLADAQRL